MNIKRFNTTGPCDPRDHYIVPASMRLPYAYDLIAQKLYFIIHAPRQSGKTTSIGLLAAELTKSEKYAALKISLEVFTREDLSQLSAIAMNIMSVSQRLPEKIRGPIWEKEQFLVNSSTVLQEYLQAWAKVCPLPVVLFFDEIDALPGKVLIDVLRQLRSGYCERALGTSFPQSIALIGMRNIRDYLTEVRPQEKSMGSASPFNVTTRSFTLELFTLEETRELLLQHTTATGQNFTEDAIVEIYKQAQGQPWLTNAIASQITTSFDA